MNDITQSVAGNEVKFSPSSNAADDWMRERYKLTGDVILIFELPEEADLARDFRDAASAANFTISSWP